MSGGPFILRHKRHAAPGPLGHPYRDWELGHVEAVVDWEDRVATLGLWPPLTADGAARQPDGSVVEVEAKTWRQIQHEAGAPAPRVAAAL